MPFQKGKSGNPGGRAKVTMADGTSLTELAREHTPSAVSTLATIAKDKKADPRARVMAATALLDRGWGKPAQHIELSGGGGLAAELEAARERLRLHNEEDRTRSTPAEPIQLHAQRLLPAPSAEPEFG